MLPLPDRRKQGDAALGYNQSIALPRSIALVRSLLFDRPYLIARGIGVPLEWLWK
ncbi:MAG: hypothetical protein VKL01_08130 [Limnothrix sp.]|nr:hypothetical protein [Limnothrix sp.]